MARLAILDHAKLELFVEDVPEEILAKYDYNEEDYILDNYQFEDGFSFSRIVGSFYVSENDGDAIPIDFKKLLK